MRPRLIVALDVASTESARAIVTRLGDACDFYKVGSELFTACGPEIVRMLRDADKEVFLDLKFHDIPNTVRGACRAAASLDVRLLTVHASGGRPVLAAAVDGAGGRTGVLAVTVLTSLDAGTLAGAWGREPLAIADEVLRLAALARDAGAHGVVCSGAEAARVHAAHGDALALLVPGIRLADDASHDQARATTPAAAAGAGATYLVLGRAVTDAPDPVAALERVRRESAG